MRTIKYSALWHASSVTTVLFLLLFNWVNVFGEESQGTEDRVSILELHDDSACREYSEDDLGANDPLRFFAEQILEQIDPRNGPSFKKTKKDYQEQIENIANEYQEFWKRIPASSRRYVDVDNDGSDELFVISAGMNTLAWSFSNFYALLDKQKDASGRESDIWQIVHFGKLHSYLRSFHFSVCDLDRDNRHDILVSLMHGGWPEEKIHIISMHSDMTIRDHSLWSADSFGLLAKDDLRPVFVQYHSDEWKDSDFGASVSARGFRKAYYHWTVERGFFEM